jgi:hypothetical protein
MRLTLIAAATFLIAIHLGDIHGDLAGIRSQCAANVIAGKR